MKKNVVTPTPSRTLVTMRIIGVGGDYVQVFGEYAHEYHAAIMENGGDGNGIDCGVPYNARFPILSCQKLYFGKGGAGNDE